MTNEEKRKIFKPGLEGIPACESAISFINGQEGVLRYRGYPIEDLTEKCTYEEVSYLLLHGELPSREQLNRFQDDLKTHFKLPEETRRIISILPKNAHPMQVLLTCVSSLGTVSSYIDEQDETKKWAAVHQLLVQIPMLVGSIAYFRQTGEIAEPDTDLSISANLIRFFNKLEKPSAENVRVMDACLILHAEHTINASTFTARVVGATLSDPFSVMSAAIASLKGRLHGGANEAVMNLLASIGTIENVRPYVDDAIANKKKIMGIGHRVYKTKDPRAVILQKAARKLFASGSKNLSIAEELETVTNEKLAAKGLYPNVDFYSGLVYDQLNISTDHFTPLFAAARTSGWLAHWLEQLVGNRIYRPTQIYNGPEKRDFQSIDAR